MICAVQIATIQSNIYVVHLGTPTVPHAPNVDSTLCSSLTLTWKVPNNRGSPITHYTVRYRQPSLDAWNEVNVSGKPSNVQVTTLENLLPTTLYVIQVSAANEVGNSGFSDVTNAWITYPGTSVLHYPCYHLVLY